MPQVTRDCLSEHDQAVLDSIFNPLQIGGPEGLATNFDIQLPEEVQDAPEEQTQEVQNAISFEIQGIAAAEEEHYDAALKLFEKAIACAPNRPAPYNNRAQVHRLRCDDSAAFEDLNKAIELSSSKGRTGCKALCQRGILYRKQNNLDFARQDFEKAANLGSQFARTQLIEINPYAALCNQMLRDVFEKLK